LHLNEIECSRKHQDWGAITDISAQPVQKNLLTLGNHIGSLKDL